MKRIGVIIILASIFGCSPVQIAGTTDETELNINGCVTSKEGMPVSGVSVQLFTYNATVSLSKASTSSDGRFVFEKMRPGTYSLWAETNDSSAAASGFFTLSDTEHSSQNLVLERGGSLTAYVRFTEKVTAANVVVSVPGTPRVTVADTTGKIRVNNMASGNFSIVLTAQSTDYDPISKHFTITGSNGDTLKDTIAFILRNPKPTNNDLWGLAAGNGVDVAVGDNGVLLSTTDGINWTNRLPAQVSVEDILFTSVAWGNNQFVAMGNNGILLRSSDGVSWTDSSSGQILSRISNYPEKITHVNDCFVIYHTASLSEVDSSTIWTSKDAVQWISHDVSFQPLEITGNGSEFIASASNGIFVSSDAHHWTQTDTIFLNEIMQGKNNLFLGVHQQIIDSDNYTSKTQIYFSSNGHCWTMVNDSACSDCQCLLWKEDCFTLFNRISNYETELLTSVDGKVWTNKGYLDVPISLDNKIIRDGDKYICVGNAGFTATSRDGLHWNDEAMVGDNTTTLVWDGTEFVAVRDGLSIFSETGTTWTKRKNDLHDTKIQSLSWGNGKYIAEYGPNVFTSVDAVTWTPSIVEANFTELPSYHPDSSSIFHVAAGEDKFVAYAVPNHFYVSSDGLAWKRTDVVVDTCQGKNSCKGTLFYGGKQFVAVDNSGFIYMSKDGSNWVVKDVGLQVSSDNVKGASGPGITVISTNGTVMVSNDQGETWIAYPAPERNSFTMLLWDGKQFVGITREAIWTTSDGQSWCRRGDVPQLPWKIKPGMVQTIGACAFDGRKYVALSCEGSIYTIDKFDN